MNKKLMNGQSISDVKSTAIKSEKALMETGQQDYYIFLRSSRKLDQFIIASWLHAENRQNININVQLAYALLWSS